MKPREMIKTHGLSFFTYYAVRVIPPLTRARLSACFGDFVLETARSLQKLHVCEKMAHLDIRTFNVGYTLSGGQDETSTIARAVFIDLDWGTHGIDKRVTLRTAGVMYAKPRPWPTGVMFSAKRCDWRQWALMVWSVQARDADEVRGIYAGKFTESGFAFLDEILTGAKSDWDEISEAELLERFKSWIASEEMLRAQESRPALNTTKLVDEVRRPYEGFAGVKRAGLHGPVLPNLFYPF